jgi:hypothetical protein
VANGVEPGTFNLVTMNDDTTYALSFFMGLQEYEESDTMQVFKVSPFFAITLIINTSSTGIRTPSSLKSEQSSDCSESMAENSEKSGDGSGSIAEITSRDDRGSTSSVIDAISCSRSLVSRRWFQAYLVVPSSGQ